MEYLERLRLLLPMKHQESEIGVYLVLIVLLIPFEEEGLLRAYHELFSLSAAHEKAGTVPLLETISIYYRVHTKSLAPVSSCVPLPTLLQ